MSQARPCPCGEASCVRAVVARTGMAAAGGAMSMLEQRSYVVGTCHGMSLLQWVHPLVSGIASRRGGAEPVAAARTQAQKRRPRGAVGLSGDAWRGR